MNAVNANKIVRGFSTLNGRQDMVFYALAAVITRKFNMKKLSKKK